MAQSSLQPEVSAKTSNPLDDLPIEGGEVIDVNPEAIEARLSHRERTAKTFTLTLLAIFAGSLVLHYFALMGALVWADKAAAEMIERQFNAWLPVISGMVGSAATYYLTRERS